MSMGKYEVTYTINGESKTINVTTWNHYGAARYGGETIVRDSRVPTEDELLLRVAIDEYGEYDLDELSSREYDDCIDTLYGDLPYYCGDNDWEDDAKTAEVSIEVKFVEEITE